MQPSGRGGPNRHGISRPLLGSGLGRHPGGWSPPQASRRPGSDGPDSQTHPVQFPSSGRAGRAGPGARPRPGPSRPSGDGDKRAPSRGPSRCPRPPTGCSPHRGHLRLQGNPAGKPRYSSGASLMSNSPVSQADSTTSRAAVRSTSAMIRSRLRISLPANTTPDFKGVCQS